MENVVVAQVSIVDLNLTGDDAVNIRYRQTHVTKSHQETLRPPRLAGVNVLPLIRQSRGLANLPIRECPCLVANARNYPANVTSASTGR
jgi:hypothetical protein